MGGKVQRIDVCWISTADAIDMRAMRHIFIQGFYCIAFTGLSTPPLHWQARLSPHGMSQVKQLSEQERASVCLPLSDKVRTCDKRTHF